MRSGRRKFPVVSVTCRAIKFMRALVAFYHTPFTTFGYDPDNIFADAWSEKNHTTESVLLLPILTVCIPEAELWIMNVCILSGKRKIIYNRVTLHKEGRKLGTWTSPHIQLALSFINIDHGASAWWPETIDETVKPMEPLFCLLLHWRKEKLTQLLEWDS